MTNIDAHLVGHNIGERGLSKTGRAKDQNMIQGFLTPPRRLDKDPHLLPHGALADVVFKSLRSDGTINHILFT